MAKRTLPLPLLLLLLATCTETLTDNRPTNPQSVAVLTQHNDNTRSGWNDKETALTTSNVNVQQFGAVFTLRVDDQVYAQPLVVGHVSVGGGDRNVVYIATVNNTLYAYDGDDGTLYWQRGVTAPGMRPPSNTDMTGACGGSYQDFSGNIGIVGTPVIDAEIAAKILVGATTCPRHVGVARRPHARRGNASLPVQCAVVSVIGIQRVVDGGDVDDVAVAAAHGDMANDQRLRIHLVVHAQREHRAKLLHVDIAGGQRGFLVVPAGPGVVVVLRQHRHRLGIRRAIVRQGFCAGGEQQQEQRQRQCALRHEPPAAGLSTDARGMSAITRPSERCVSVHEN